MHESATNFTLWRRDGTEDGDLCAWLIQYEVDGVTYSTVLGNTAPTADDARRKFAAMQEAVR